MVSPTSPYPVPGLLQSPHQYAETILRNASLGDPRRARRSVEIMRACLLHPGKRFGQMFPSKYQVKGAYRFMENDYIDPLPLSQSLWKTSAHECMGLETVFVVHDTTDLNFTSRRQSLQGAGPIGKQAPWGYGFYLHSSMAVREDGLPLGILYHHLWARDLKEKGKAQKRRQRAFEDKESFKWVRGSRASQLVLQQGGGLLAHPVRLIHIMDRESDVFPVLQDITASGNGLIIRAAQDRCLGAEDTRLWDFMRSCPVGGRITVPVRARADRKPRMATCAVRWSSIVVNPPRSSKGKGVPLRLYAVWVREIDPPAGVAPLEWMLITTESVECLEEALQIIDAYRLRWRIEEFHLILKSGCRIEDLQFRTRERIERMLPFLLAPALRVLMLRYLADTQPDEPATQIFSPLETEALITYVRHYFEVSLSSLTVSEARYWIARIGGFLGRKCDGRPGVRTLWRGTQDFQLIVTMYQAMNDP